LKGKGLDRGGGGGKKNVLGCGGGRKERNVWGKDFGGRGKKNLQRGKRLNKDKKGKLLCVPQAKSGEGEDKLDYRTGKRETKKNFFHWSSDAGKAWKRSLQGHGDREAWRQSKSITKRVSKGGGKTGEEAEQFSEKGRKEGTICTPRGEGKKNPLALVRAPSQGIEKTLAGDKKGSPRKMGCCGRERKSILNLRRSYGLKG